MKPQYRCCLWQQPSPLKTLELWRPITVLDLLQMHQGEISIPRMIFRSQNTGSHEFQWRTQTLKIWDLLSLLILVYCEKYCSFGSSNRLQFQLGFFSLKQWFLIKEPPSHGFVERWMYTKSYCKKVQFLRGQFLTKKLSVPGGNFSNYFMKFIVFSQFYRSKSATLEIAYDKKIDSLLCNLYFPLKQQSAKTIRTYIQI